MQSKQLWRCNDWVQSDQEVHHGISQSQFNWSTMWENGPLDQKNIPAVRENNKKVNLEANQHQYVIMDPNPGYQ